MYIFLQTKHGDDRGMFISDVVPRIGETIKGYNGNEMRVDAVEYLVHLHLEAVDRWRCQSVNLTVSPL